jgi:hypothetical protein
MVGNELKAVCIFGCSTTVAGNCSGSFSSTSRKDEVDENEPAMKSKKKHNTGENVDV